MPTRFSRALLPLMPRAFSKLDLSAYDVVITVSSAFSKNVRTAAGAKNLCYCLTPPRYLWDRQRDYLRVPLTRTVSAPVSRWLRAVDLAAARRVDEFVAISNTVADRVRRAYSREASVVYPPVDTDRFQPSGRPPEDFLLVVSRLVPYKRADLAIVACNKLRRRLLIVGNGPERRRLERIAGPTVEFLGSRSDREVAALLASCRAFIFPGFEDFGIAPVEAQAAGRPVVAFGAGGASETVIDGVTGVFFREQTAESLLEAIERLPTSPIDPGECRRNALRFSVEVFRNAMGRTVAAMA